MMRSGRKMAVRRRGSITSQASSRGSQILPAITKLALLGRGSFTSQGSQILPAITKKNHHPLGGAPPASTVVDISAGSQQQRQDLLSERIERFSLNLPGDASSDESDSERPKPPAVTQSTQTVQTWNAATQTSPSLATHRPIKNASKGAVSMTTKGTQMSSPSSSNSSPEVVRKSLPKTPAVATTHYVTTVTKCPRGQADGSPNGSSTEEEDDDDEAPSCAAANTGLSSPSQSLLNYLLPIKSEQRNKSNSKNG